MDEMDWTFGVVLVTYPPSRWTELSSYTYCISSKCELFVDALGLFSAQIDSLCLQVNSLCATYSGMTHH